MKKCQALPSSKARWWTCCPSHLFKLMLRSVNVLPGLKMFWSEAKKVLGVRFSTPWAQQPLPPVQLRKHSLS